MPSLPGATDNDNEEAEVELMLCGLRKVTVRRAEEDQSPKVLASDDVSLSDIRMKVTTLHSSITALQAEQSAVYAALFDHNAEVHEITIALSAKQKTETIGFVQDCGTLAPPLASGGLLQQMFDRHRSESEEVRARGIHAGNKFREQMHFIQEKIADLERQEKALGQVLEAESIKCRAHIDRLLQNLAARERRPPSQDINHSTLEGATPPLPTDMCAEQGEGAVQAKEDLLEQVSALELVARDREQQCSELGAQLAQKDQELRLQTREREAAIQAKVELREELSALELRAHECAQQCSELVAQLALKDQELREKICEWERTNQAKEWALDSLQNVERKVTMKTKEKLSALELVARDRQQQCSELGAQLAQKEQELREQTHERELAMQAKEELMKQLSNLALVGSLHEQRCFELVAQLAQKDQELSEQTREREVAIQAKDKLQSQFQALVHQQEQRVREVQNQIHTFANQLSGHFA